MKSYGTAFDRLFETYDGMRGLSEITAEIEAMAWIDDPGQEPDLEQDDAIDDMSGIVNHFYHKGYRDALRWVTGGE